MSATKQPSMQCVPQPILFWIVLDQCVFSYLIHVQFSSHLNNLLLIILLPIFFSYEYMKKLYMRTSGWRIIVKKITQFEENVSSTVMIFFHIILHPAVLIYDFIYIHNFIIILSRVYNEPITWPAQRWLVSLILVERGTAIAEGQGFESRTSLNFFRLFFHNCKSYIIFLVIYIAIFFLKNSY